METDHTLPIGGAWIFVKEQISLTHPSGKGGVEIAPLTVIFAKPDRVYVEGSFLPGGFVYDRVSRSKLEKLWRHRQGGKPDPIDVFNPAAFEAKFCDAFEEEDLSLEQRVRVQAPGGECILNPHEWSKVKNMSEYIDMVSEGAFEMVELGGFSSNRKLADQIHYIRSRGLSRAEAIHMIVGNVNRPGVFMLEAHPDVRAHFGFH